MKSWVLVVALAACKKEEPPPPATLESLITDDATSVMRTTTENFPLVAISRELMDTQPCWTEMLNSTIGAYQVLMVGDSYFIAESNVQREAFEKCFTVVFKPGVTFKDDDGLLSLETPLGMGYMGWRAGYIVFGKKDHVKAALGTHHDETVARWKKLLPTKALPMAMASTDKTMTVLMGTNLVDWSLTVDKLTKTPAPFISGTFVAHYETPDAATKALAYIKDWGSRGKFPRHVSDDPDITAAFDGFAAAIGKLKPVVTGNELTLPYDSDQLGGPLFFAGVLSHFDKLSDKLGPK